MPKHLATITCGIAVGIALCLSGAAKGGEVDFTKTRQKDLFKDLPGVTLPDDPLQSKNACTSTIRSENFPNSGRRMPVRVYSCQQGRMVFESNTPPDEDAWRRYRLNRN